MKNPKQANFVKTMEMKRNKLYLLLAVSALLLCGACHDSNKGMEPQPVEESISINPQAATVGSKGGMVSVLVTSSGTWTLAGDGDAFVTPSAMKGKDGDAIDFTVKANDQETDRMFSYTFTCGKKSAQLRITLRKKAAEADEQLEIYFPEGSNRLPQEGGKVTVLVTSSGNWTLEGRSDFVTPSATSGEDGAEVVFDVAANSTEQEMSADYTFRMGHREVPFHITVQGGVPERIEIVSKSEIRLASAADDRVAVKLKTNVDSRDLKAEISGADDGWLTWTIARPSEDAAESDVTAYFAVRQNDAAAPREATVTIRGRRSGEAVLKFTQAVQTRLEAGKTAYFLSPEAQKIDVPVTANVEFDVSPAPTGNGWLTCDGYSDGALHFTVEALSGVTARECAVTLTEKPAPDNAAPKTLVITLTQKPKGLIERVADMRKSRCYFPSLKNAAALNDIKSSGTMEALVNIQEARNTGSLSTIMGVEDRFLLRMGDTGVEWNQLQLATYNNNISDPSLTLSELNKWYHIAVTWNDYRIFFYINGKLVYEDFLVLYENLNLGVVYRGSEDDSNRAFWIGYSYDADRYFPGYMAEVRIWNRALSEEEIRSENHFYSVPENSPGLVGYWKLNEESGFEVKDYSSSGNHMRSEHNVRTQGNKQVGMPGLNYVEMNLP